MHLFDAYIAHSNLVQKQIDMFRKNRWKGYSCILVSLRVLVSDNAVSEKKDMIVYVENFDCGK